MTDSDKTMPPAWCEARHPHEPGIPPALDDEGRCLVCVIIVERNAALREAETQRQRADGLALLVQELHRQTTYERVQRWLECGR